MIPALSSAFVSMMLPPPVLKSRHLPVLCEEAITALAPERGGVFFDATYGAGGYSSALAQGGAERVVAIDRDPDAVAQGREELAGSGLAVTLETATFDRLAGVAARLDCVPCNGVVFDLGVSSMQIDEAERGFSFLRPGPLDMRMSREGRSAADIVNTADEETLAGLLRAYGEERAARRIAQAIVGARRLQPIMTTDRLVEVVATASGRVRPGGIHPATRTFQALRIAVNDELRQLVLGLEAAERILAPGGVLCAVSFHSLEDRIVKQYLAARTRSESANRHLPQPEILESSFELLHARARRPGAEEVQGNPRARSARLRAARRTHGPARTLEQDTPSFPDPGRRARSSRRRAP